MKILFVSKNEDFMVPLGLCTISAVARGMGHETLLCEMNREDVLAKIRSARPDIVAYSASTGESKHYVALNKKIKDEFPEMVTIMGGPHPTFFPGVVNEGRFDAVCVGEREMVMGDILKAVSAGTSLEGIPNVVCSGKTAEYTVRELIENLDTIPFPDYGIVYDNSALGRFPLKSFMTSRGCPYSCTYCFNAKWRGLYKDQKKAVRRHSVDYVIEDIRRVMARWPLSNVKFYDDVFALAADEWLEEFSKKYREKVGLPFFILTRAEALNEDMVKLLKYAGCRTISMSIESGNERIRKEVLNRSVTDEQLVKAHRLCEKYGIYTFTNCMIGLPGSTIDDELKSIELAGECRVTWAEYPIYFPYPGTELGDKVIAQGYFGAAYGAAHTSYMNNSILNCFSNAHKNMLRNISVLGPIATLFPALKRILLAKAIRLPHNRLFTVMYYAAKMHVIRNKIYVTKTNALNSIRILLKSLKQELFRHNSRDAVCWKGQE